MANKLIVSPSTFTNLKQSEVTVKDSIVRAGLIQEEQVGDNIYDNFDENGIIKDIWTTVKNANIINEKMVFDATYCSNQHTSYVEGENYKLNLLNNRVVFKVTIYGNAKAMFGYFDGTYDNSMFFIYPSNRSVRLQIGGHGQLAYPSLFANIPDNNNSSITVYGKMERDPVNNYRTQYSISLDGVNWELCVNNWNDYMFDKIRFGIFYHNSTNHDFPNTSAEFHYIDITNYKSELTEGIIDNFDGATLNPFWDDSKGVRLENNTLVLQNNITANHGDEVYIQHSNTVTPVDYDVKIKVSIWGKNKLAIGKYASPYFLQTIIVDSITPTISAVNGGYHLDYKPEWLVSDENAEQTVYVWFKHEKKKQMTFVLVSPDGINWEIAFSQLFNITYINNPFMIMGIRAYINHPDHPNDIGCVHYFKYLPYRESMKMTLNNDAYWSAQLPAKLKSINSITPRIIHEGTGGEIHLKVRHKSDEDSDYIDLYGNKDIYTDLGVIDGNPMIVPEYISKSNDNFGWELEWIGDGLHSYPTIDRFTVEWSSDVTAPSEPTITTAIATSESILTMLFADLPADAYAIIYEVDINGAGSLPFSTRGKIESGYGYMRFVGSKTEVQKEAEINSLLHSIKGLREGDVVVITAFARDKVGNISAGKQKAITMTGAQYKTMLTKVISESVKTTVVIDSLKEV